MLFWSSFVLLFFTQFFFTLTWIEITYFLLDLVLFFCSFVCVCVCVWVGGCALPICEAIEQWLLNMFCWPFFSFLFFASRFYFFRRSYFVVKRKIGRAHKKEHPKKCSVQFSTQCKNGQWRMSKRTEKWTLNNRTEKCWIDFLLFL